MYRHIQIEPRGPVLWIFFNRPEVKNAIDLATAQEFLAAVRKGLKDKKTAVLVLSGRGGVFSSGGHIKKMSETRDLKNFFLKISKTIHTAVLDMRNGEKPILAAIPGYVGGIALGITFSTDLRIASTDAQFSAATTRLGLVANGGTTYFLPRMVGLARAGEILMTGKTLSANESLRLGLVNRVVPPNELERTTQEIAEGLAAGPRKALARLKKVLQASLSSTLAAQLERERQSIAWSATTRDFKEGMSAFLQKRKPIFNKG